MPYWYYDFNAAQRIMPHQGEMWCCQAEELA